MHTQSAAQQDSPITVIPPIEPRMPWRVVSVEALPGYCLRVRFVDGLEGVVDMTPLIHSSIAGVFSTLTDASLFAQVYVEYGTVTWPNGIDLAPDAMYAEIKKAGSVPTAGSQTD